MGHKDARAIQQLQGVKKDDPFDTDEKKIHELRKQRDPALGVIAVNRFDFIDALFRAYDTEKAAVAQLGPACAALLKRAEAAEAEVQNQIQRSADEELKFRATIATLDTTIGELREKNAKLNMIVADPKGQFGEPSTVGYDVYAAAGKVLGVDRDEAKKLMLGTLHSEPGLNPAEQGLDSVEEQTLNADAEADRQEESTQVPVPQAAEAIMDSGTAPGVPPVEAT
jgi:hypothetical protein